ncbi:activating signal cointegrator 1 complex subunit 1 [Ctenocephalides felis]|uniref:activating signal cointegrator 1 complex subunit 1 n=1 Tax=Ctenocephalides felis TaxID=7515 RepID=UPI000E6E30F6|nr:activating signal cointegrator 1 complex subunit 1 [Ctenocephalides felis]
MDILKPELVWISGRCYRVNAEHNTDATGPDVLEENDFCGMGDEDINNDCEAEYAIETLANGNFRSSFHVPQFYYAQIIGARGAVRRKIELETQTKISIPRKGQRGDVVITGNSEKNVFKARRRIDLIVIASRNKQPFTHFLSIPFNSAEIKDRFQEFKARILENPLIFVDPKSFQIPEKLHLTIGTMCLMDNEDRALAAELLNECRKSVIDPILEKLGPIKLTLSGLEIMNDDPSTVDVLYGCIQETQWSNDGTFQNLLDKIVDFFSRKGLIQKQYDHVKLHVTLLNSLFSQDSEEMARKPFNASIILNTFGSYEFGSQELQEIHLSQRYSTGCDGYYQSTMILQC